MFSVGRESLSGWLVLAVVVAGGEGGMTASEVRERLKEISCVSMSGEEIGDVLRALERQGFVSNVEVYFCATKTGHKRVNEVMSCFQEVVDSNS